MASSAAPFGNVYVTDTLVSRWAVAASKCGTRDSWGRPNGQPIPTSANPFSRQRVPSHSPPPIPRSSGRGVGGYRVEVPSNGAGSGNYPSGKAGVPPKLPVSHEEVVRSTTGPPVFAAMPPGVSKPPRHLGASTVDAGTNGLSWRCRETLRPTGVEVAVAPRDGATRRREQVSMSPRRHKSPEAPRDPWYYKTPERPNPLPRSTPVVRTPQTHAGPTLSPSSTSQVTLDLTASMKATILAAPPARAVGTSHSSPEVATVSQAAVRAAATVAPPPPPASMVAGPWSCPVGSGGGRSSPIGVRASTPSKQATRTQQTSSSASTCAALGQSSSETRSLSLTPPSITPGSSTPGLPLARPSGGRQAALTSSPRPGGISPPLTPNVPVPVSVGRVHRQVSHVRGQATAPAAAPCRMMLTPRAPTQVGALGSGCLASASSTAPAPMIGPPQRPVAHGYQSSPRTAWDQVVPLGSSLASVQIRAGAANGSFTSGHCGSFGAVSMPTETRGASFSVEESFIAGYPTPPPPQRGGPMVTTPVHVAAAVATTMPPNGAKPAAAARKVSVEDKIWQWLRTIPIGNGAHRGWDETVIADIVNFAIYEDVEHLSAEEIYKRYVEHQVDKADNP